MPDDNLNELLFTFTLKYWGDSEGENTLTLVPFTIL